MGKSGLMTLSLRSTKRKRENCSVTFSLEIRSPMVAVGRNITKIYHNTLPQLSTPPTTLSSDQKPSTHSKTVFSFLLVFLTGEEFLKDFLRFSSCQEDLQKQKKSLDLLAKILDQILPGFLTRLLDHY